MNDVPVKYFFNPLLIMKNVKEGEPTYDELRKKLRVKKLMDE